MSTWREFQIKIHDAESGERYKTLAMIDTNYIIRYYPTHDDHNNKAVGLIFDDGDNIVVYNSYKEVKQIMGHDEEG